MLLAIDVGNTHTVYAVYQQGEWAGIWRRATDPTTTEDEVTVWLKTLFDIAGLPYSISEVVCASVAPGVNEMLTRLCDKWLKAPLRFLRNGQQVGVEVDYEPKTAVGADRIANALGALALCKPPFIVVDFGTGTTFDAVDERGVYVGGAILPGVLVSSQALFTKAAKLPQVEQVPLTAPETAIGKSTVHSLQSGIVLGYAGSIDALAHKINDELGGNATVIATGGLGGMFMGVCKSIQRFEPTLTLDGLVIANDRLRS